MPDVKTQMAAYLEHAVQHVDLEDALIDVRARSFKRSNGPVDRQRRLMFGTVAAGLLAIVSIGAILIFRTGVTEPVDTVPTYEAVFLRLEAAEEGHAVIAVAIGSDGTEREVARIPGAWGVYEANIGEDDPRAPMGAVSPTGLLAMPSRTLGLTLQWEIIDLGALDMERVVIPGLLDQLARLSTPYFSLEMEPSVFWGPGDRLAIPSYNVSGPSSDYPLDYELSFVDGRTGAVQTADVPENRKVLPAWSDDGFGVLLGDSSSGVGTPSSNIPIEVLRPDGTITEATSTTMETACRTQSGPGAQIAISDGSVTDGDVSLEIPSGVTFACFSPDDAGLVIRYDIGTGAASPSNPLGALFIGGAWLEVEGAFAGWIEVAAG